GAASEPFRVLREPRMVGRALHGEIKRHLQTVMAAGSDEAAEGVDRAEPRVDGIVSAFGGADGVRGGGVALGGAGGGVTALAVDAADRMDRRQVYDVEAEAGDVGQSGDRVIERAVLARHRALAARNHLVPGARAGDGPVGHEWQRGRSREMPA